MNKRLDNVTLSIHTINNLPWIDVQSTNIAEIARDNNDVYIHYYSKRASTIYIYYNVSEIHYHGVINASSNGHYASVYIKTVYDYAKVTIIE